MMDTTDISILRSLPRAFTWGPISTIYEVGPYTIAKYTNKKGETLYHAWVEGKDTHHSYESLDAALVGAIAYRHEGPNSQAAGYFMRMMGQGE